MKRHALSAVIAFAVVLIFTLAAQAQQGWPVYGGDPGNTRYSTLTQITPANVKTLKVAWVLQLGSLRSQESTPLVIGDTMYVTSSHGPKNVFAVEAKTGVVKWRYSPDVPSGIDQYACCDVNNRGVAFANGRVFVGRLDGALVALDAATGKHLWHFPTGANMAASPISYAVGGRQFVAVAAGNVIYAFALASQGK